MKGNKSPSRFSLTDINLCSVLKVALSNNIYPEIEKLVAGKNVKYLRRKMIENFIFLVL